jgi:hypothetical protein
MKRFFITFLIILFISSFAYADSFDIASPSTQTADAAVMNNAGYLKGFLITPDGTNAVTITFYDNASAASGTQLTPDMTFAGDGGTQGITFPAYVQCKNGIYADITTAGTVEYTVYYRDR